MKRGTVGNPSILVYLPAALALAFAGCATGGGDAARTRNEGTAAGTVVGAGIGAGVGALTAKDKGKGALVGAGAGAVAGGLTGAVAGDAVAKKKAAFIAREDAISMRIALVQRQTEDRRKVNAALQATVARQKQRLAALKAAGGADNTSGWRELRRNAASEIAAVDRRARTWQGTIDAHKEFVKKYHTDSRRVELENDLSSMDAERVELLRQRDQLEAIAEGPR